MVMLASSLFSGVLVAFVAQVGGSRGGELGFSHEGWDFYAVQTHHLCFGDMKPFWIRRFDFHSETSPPYSVHDSQLIWNDACPVGLINKVYHRHIVLLLPKKTKTLTKNLCFIRMQLMISLVNRWPKGLIHFVTSCITYISRGVAHRLWWWGGEIRPLALFQKKLWRFHDVTCINFYKVMLHV